MIIQRYSGHPQVSKVWIGEAAKADGTLVMVTGKSRAGVERELNKRAGENK